MTVHGTPEFIDREVLTLTREGEWLADGAPITHGPTLSTFSKNLHLQPDGSWWLEIGRERKKVDVEDTGQFVRLIEGSVDSGFEIVLIDGSREKLDPGTLLLTPGRLTCLTRAGIEAKFLRAPYSDLLLQALSEKDGRYRLRIEGREIELGASLPETILFFDGICGLCSKAVDFLMRADWKKRIHYAPLQGRTACALLPAVQRLNLDSVALLNQGKLFDRSTAMLRSLTLAGGLWKIAGILLLIPRPIRDWAYDVIAVNRYSWFGRSETCRLPSPEERERFLD